MKETYSNVIATKFQVDTPWKRKWLFQWERKIQAFPLCRKLSKGALYEETGHLIYDSIRKGGVDGDFVVSIAPIVINSEIPIIEKIEGKSAFLGNLYSQYGHFITEGLSRLSEFETFDEYDHLLFYPFIFDHGKTELKPYHKFFFEKMGIDTSKVKFLTDTTRIENVTVFRQLWTLNYQVDSRVNSLYEVLREIKLKEEVEGQRIYLSRKESSRVGNIKEIENLFKENSFLVYYPEDLTMDQQFAIYRGANTIVSLAGSTLHNMLFGGNETFFIELGDSRSPVSPHKMQQMINDMAISKYRFIPFHSSSNNNWDVDKLKGIVDSL